MDIANFDFKSYQIKHANASSEAEKKALNQELKDIYALLSAEDKFIFNKGLTAFLAIEQDRLASDYNAIKKQAGGEVQDN